MTVLNILAALAVLAFLYAISLYNRLVAMRQATKNAYADIDVQTKQRFDLIPNLVETVKGYASHESEIFTKVTEARAAAMQGTTPAAQQQAEAVLTGALGRLMAVAEAYPDLKANANFQSLQAELSDLENKIAAARRYYNNAITEYNTSIQQFPGVLLANAFGFTPQEGFAVDEAERPSLKEAPKVSFKE